MEGNEEYGARLFSAAINDKTGYSGHRLKHMKFCLNVRKNFLTVRVVEYWHRLPTEVVKPDWTQAWATYSRWLCLSRGIGLNSIKKSLPTLVLLSLATSLHPLIRYLYTLIKFFFPCPLPSLLSFLHAEQFTALSLSLCEWCSTPLIIFGAFCWTFSSIPMSVLDWQAEDWTWYSRCVSPVVMVRHVIALHLCRSYCISFSVRMLLI